MNWFQRHLNWTWVVVFTTNLILVGFLGLWGLPTLVVALLFKLFNGNPFLCLVGYLVFLGVSFSPVGYISDYVLRSKGRSTNWTWLWPLLCPLWLGTKEGRKNNE